MERLDVDNRFHVRTVTSALARCISMRMSCPTLLASTGGNVTISNVGGGAVSFGNTASISASGSIILPKLVQAVGTLTLTASGTKDLSALSLASDLSGKAPVNVGTGTYLPPAPGLL